MRSNPVAVIWLVGIVAAIVAYAFGATHALAAFWAFVVTFADEIDYALGHLPILAASFIPALAIGAIVAFVPLAILSIRSGHRGRMALVLIPSVFLWLAGRDATRMEWFEALLVAGAGALVMTGRLRSRSGLVVRSR